MHQTEAQLDKIALKTDGYMKAAELGDPSKYRYGSRSVP